MTTERDRFAREIETTRGVLHETSVQLGNVTATLRRIMADRDRLRAALETIQEVTDGPGTAMDNAAALRTIGDLVDDALSTFGQERPAEHVPARPTIVCLCGSTRFWRTFQEAGLAETLAGRIVLSIGAASGTDDAHFANLLPDEYDRIKAMLDELHLRKIDMADEVLCLNVGGYIGESTRRELACARRLGKPIRWWE